MGNRKTKLTKREVEAARPGSDDYILWDTDLKGFGCKVTPLGRKSYFVFYRNKAGEQRRPSIGVHGVLTAEQARDKATEILREASLGGDPSAENRARKEQSTFAQFAEEYLLRHATPRKKPRSVEEDRRNLNRHILPRLGSRKLGEIGRANIVKLHHDMSDTPGAANRCIALLSKMFNLAELWGYRPDHSNPCRHVEKYKERKIERYLSLPELERLGKTLREAQKLKTEPRTALDAIRLLLFTGCRRDEVLSLKWDYVDLDARCLRLPDSKTGAKAVYLNDAAVEVLESIKKFPDNPYVFPGVKPGQHWINISKPWLRLRVKAKIPDVRIHDLRHSFASIGASAGLGLPIIGALLGHKEVSTTQRYAHLDADPLRAANNAIGVAIQKALKGRSDARRQR